MPYLLVKHGVKDFEHWKTVLESQEEVRKEYGMEVKWLMHEVGNPNMLVFMLEIESIERANEFMNTPEAAQAGKDAGVTGDALVMFLDKVDL